VASFLAVIITLGVVTQEQTNGHQREAVLPSADRWLGSETRRLR